MLLRELMAERGWTDADVHAVLSEKGVTTKRGAPISLQGVRNYAQTATAEVPGHWAVALGLEAPAARVRAPRAEKADDTDSPADASSTSQGRRSERPPVAPPGTVPVVLEPGAQKRIAGAYKFAGAALAAGSGSQGVAVVWSDSSDKIAELWIAAAAENPWAARFVNLMQAGGPVGDLAAGHLYLAGATLYVLGAAIPGGDAIFPKYARYRPVVDVPAESNGSQPGEPQGDGAVVEPAETRLG